MEFEIRDERLFESGEQKISWVKRNMPVLSGLEETYGKTRPLNGLRVALSVHLEAKTAYLCRVLSSLGAEMFVTGSNPLSTQDDVAAALVHGGMSVFAWHGATDEEYRRHLKRVIENRPHLIVDDGGDLVHLIRTEYPEQIPDIIGGCEETTTGVLRLRALEKAGKLPFPMVLVNDADSKHLFDNRYGTGQSVFDALTRTTNLIVAGKTVVVAGYGWCGKGVSLRAKGLGAKVIVCEIDPIKAMEAVMDGFTVLPMEKAAPLGDLFITVTGCKDVITKDHAHLLKDGAILCNAGHFDVEVDVKGLQKIAVRTYEARKNVQGYVLENGRTVFVLAKGRLVNLAAGDGHPAEIMDLSFSIQALCLLYLKSRRGKLDTKLIAVPREVDLEVALCRLRAWNIGIDTLTEEQKASLNDEI